MADKGAAHLTMPMQHPVDQTHIAIARICELVKEHLCDATGRTFEVAVRRTTTGRFLIRPKAEPAR